jgi:hypothetical protein
MKAARVLRHRPNLSATTDRKPSPSSHRKNTELRLPRVCGILSSCVFQRRDALQFRSSNHRRSRATPMPSEYAENGGLYRRECSTTCHGP